MAGEVTQRRVNKPAAVQGSTPVADRDRAVAQTSFAKLSSYQVDVRSFHPNKNFEKLGFRFHGDNRPFSLGESYFDPADIPANAVTSRVWQRYHFNLASARTGDVTAIEDFKLETESNPSAPGPGLWGVLGHTEDYKAKNLKPRGKLAVTRARSPHGGQREMALNSWYGGENHAFLASVTLQEKLGTTHVPTLDVFSEISVSLERVRLYMDVACLVYGDGFPNCESVLTDSAGEKLFLGTHVRIGAPATHLWGEGQKLMFATALRVEVDANGNFGNRLWVFSHVLGGPPSLRDEYSTSKYPERCQLGTTPRVFSNPFDDRPATFTWDCGRPEQMRRRAPGGAHGPLHLSAFSDLNKVRSELAGVWALGPITQTTRREWNASHLHGDPNYGRAPDSYDLSPDKWRRR